MDCNSLCRCHDRSSASSIVTNNMPSLPTCEFVPYLSISDAEKAVAFYSRIFGVAPHLLLNMPDGRVMHCEFRIGNTRFFLSEELPEHGGTPSPTRLGATSVAIHLYVDDCDAMVETMTNNDSTVLMAPTDMFWGERFARVRDPFGHEWGITTQLREMSADAIQAAAKQMFAEMSE
jgi:PhnB protein